MFSSLCSGSLVIWQGHQCVSARMIIIGILCCMIQIGSSDVIESSAVINRCCPVGYLYHDETCRPDNGTGVSADFFSNSNGSHSTNFASNTSNNISIGSAAVIGVPPYPSASVYRFMLVDHIPKETCMGGSFIEYLVLHPVVAENKSNFEFSRVQLTSRAELRVDNEYYSSPEFCLIGVKEGIASFRVCNATCGEKVPCIRKCCDLNEGWSYKPGRSGCYATGTQIWRPEFYQTATTKATSAILKSIHPHYIIVNPQSWCKRTNTTRGVLKLHDRLANGKTKWKFRIAVDGGVYYRLSRYTWKLLPHIREKSCFDAGVQWRNDTGNEVQPYYSGLLEDDVIFECGMKGTPRAKAQPQLYGFFMVISCVFLLLTLVVHFMLWEKQSLHGWTLMSYCASLFLMYIFFAIDKFSSGNFKRTIGGKIGGLCEFIGVAANFFFILTFCWMTVINFDLWLTFKKLKPPSGRSRGLKRYLMYAAFASIVPTAIIVSAVTLDAVYRDDPESGVIVPEYASKKCLPDSEYAQLIFQHGPAGVLLILNVAFFVGTVFSIHKAQKNSKLASSSSSKSSQQRSRIRLFTKLLFAMGIPWIFEIIGWYVEQSNPQVNSWHWLLFDLVNVLQGACIFFIFTCNRDMLHSLDQKYPKFQRLRSRLQISTDTAERIVQQLPFMKGLVRPVTKTTDTTTSARHGQTDSSSNAGSSYAAGNKSDIEMRRQPHDTGHPSKAT